jgi:predicted double-glycine peptidase
MSVEVRRDATPLLLRRIALGRESPVLRRWGTVPISTSVWNVWLCRSGDDNRDSTADYRAGALPAYRLRCGPPKRRATGRRPSVLEGHGMSSTCLLTMFLLCSAIGSENAIRARVSPESFRCGPNAVYMLLKLEGREVRFSDILEGTRVDAQGVSLTEVRNALEKHGMAAELIKCQPSDLPLIFPPYIMYVNTPRSANSVDDLGHFVIVVSINQKTLQVLDASTAAEKTYQRHKITNIWDGVLIVPKRERSIVPEIVFLIGSLTLFAASCFVSPFSRTRRS